MLTNFWHYIRKVFLGFFAAPSSNNDRISDGKPLYLFGSSPTAINDIFKTNEGSDFPNIYPGTMPPDGPWGTFVDNDNISYTIHPVIATGLTMEKVWDSYQSTEPDQDPSIDQIGRFMRSSAYDLGDFDRDGTSDPNGDGDTKFFTNGPIAPT